MNEQINGSFLRGEYGDALIDKVISAINSNMNARSRIISGRIVESEELVRVFGQVSEADVRNALEAISGKQVDNFSGYFGSVLFNRIKDRLDAQAVPQTRPRSEPQYQHPSRPVYNKSIDVDEIMEEIMAKYRH